MTYFQSHGRGNYCGLEGSQNFLFGSLFCSLDLELGEEDGEGKATVVEKG